MIHRFALSLAFVLSLAAASFVASGFAAPADSPDTINPLTVGTPAPAAAVRTPGGEPAELAAALAGQPTVLVFYRGGWCPYCNKHLAALAEAEPDLRALGYRIVAVSPDAPAGLQATTDKHHLKYLLLSDRDMVAASAYGVAFRVDAATVAKYRAYKIDLPPVPAEPDARWLPVPAVFLIDRAGVIRFAHAHADYKIRLTTEALLAAASAARR